MLTHWLGWIAFIIGITELLTYFSRKFQMKSLKHFRGKHHITWGKMMIIVALFHGVLTGLFFTLNLGTLCWIGMFTLFGTYQYRKNLVSIGSRFIGPYLL